MHLTRIRRFIFMKIASTSTSSSKGKALLRHPRARVPLSREAWSSFRPKLNIVYALRKQVCSILSFRRRIDSRQQSWMALPRTSFGTGLKAESGSRRRRSYGDYIIHRHEQASSDEDTAR